MQPEHAGHGFEVLMRSLPAQRQVSLVSPRLSSASFLPKRPVGDGRERQQFSTSACSLVVRIQNHEPSREGRHRQCLEDDVSSCLAGKVLQSLCQAPAPPAALRLLKVSEAFWPTLDA